MVFIIAKIPDNFIVGEELKDDENEVNNIRYTQAG